jgi:hypothetical protein
LWNCGKILKLSTVFPQCLECVEKRVDYRNENVPRALILLAFGDFDILWKSRQNTKQNDDFLSPCGKTHKKFLFPQDFVEKCFFDKNRKFMTFWHKSVAVGKSPRTCPHFVLKIHTDFPQAKIVKKVNKINALKNLSTVSTVPIIYYNYYFIYLFHSFHYFYRAREKFLNK